MRMSELLGETCDWERLARESGFKTPRMALLCSMSARHLQRIFRKQFGRTPRSWLRVLQCRLAKALIAQGCSSKAAAAELNFATEAHFCREFKKIYMVSPQSFAPSQISLRSEKGLATLRPAAEYVAPGIPSGVSAFG